MTSAVNIGPKEVENLISEKKWDEVLESTQAVSEDPSCPAVFRTFRGKALLEMGRLAEAEAELRASIAAGPGSRWPQFLLISALINAGKDRAALEIFREFRGSDDKDVEDAKSVFVDQATKVGNFALASTINESRRVIKEAFPRPKFAVALQCFNKHDTLEAVFSTLVKCRGSRDFSLVIIQDSAVGSKKEAAYTPQVEKVSQTIANWMPLLSEKFNSVVYLRNPTNKGTAPTCRRLLDRVCQSYEGFVFIEDDCLLAEDALEWSLYHLENSISPTSYWFATCESIFFDSRGVRPTPEQIASMTRIARSTAVKGAYIDLDFVPSTCFMTTSRIWNFCASQRSFTRGPESLNKFVLTAARKTLFPLVPRASDIGMLHEFGYSVSTLGANNVKEIKNTYLFSEGPLDARDIYAYDGNRDILFGASVKFHQPHIDRLVAQYLKEQAEREAVSV